MQQKQIQNQVQQRWILLRHQNHQRERVVRLVSLKKHRLSDVVEQSNEQMKQMQDYVQSNSVTLKERSKEREEDREFFRQMLGMMSQTMMGMTQMLVQGAGSGYHPPIQGYSPQSVQPNYTFPPGGMGYGFHSPPARLSSASSVTSEPRSSEENDYYSFYKLLIQVHVLCQ